MNVRPEIIRLLKENIGSKLLGIDLGNNFLDLTPKAKTVKAKINEWNYGDKKASSQQRKPSLNEKATYGISWRKYLPMI